MRASHPSHSSRYKESSPNLIKKCCILIKKCRSLFHKKLLTPCAGNVESALTLLPTTILFLSVLQLGASALNRVVFIGVADAQATEQSFVTFDNAHSQDANEIPLSGGGSLIVVRNPHDLPSFSPLLPQGDNFIATGMSVK